MQFEICPVSGETWQEEIINHRTHLLGFILSVIGSIFLVAYAYMYGDYWSKIGCSVYGTSLVLLYGASAYYHGCTVASHKKLLKIADHACIFLLIAGTYTPIALGPLRHNGGWEILAIEWTIAAVGVIFKIVAINRFKFLSTLAYLAMGWLIVLNWQPLSEAVPEASIFWLIAGGLSYSFGTIFFIWESLPFNHGIWHFFVLGGSVSHYIVVLDLITLSP